MDLSFFQYGQYHLQFTGVVIEKLLEMNSEHWRAWSECLHVYAAHSLHLSQKTNKIAACKLKVQLYFDRAYSLIHFDI